MRRLVVPLISALITPLQTSGDGSSGSAPPASTAGQPIGLLLALTKAS